MVEVPPPLAIGTVTLADGTSVKGFVAEPRALTGAEDITHLGGWRLYRARVVPERLAGAGGFGTSAWRYQKPLPYRLATPPAA